MSKYLRDPLVHFTVIGALLFVAYALYTSSAQRAEQTITVTASDMERMAALYTAEAGTLPSPADIQAMVADHVRNAALTREARRLGLDEGDTVVERRLAQKMTFMIADMTDLEPPDESVLKQWYEVHSESFTTPEQRSFQLVYFSQSDHDQIEATLDNLNSGASSEWQTAGQAFMLQRQYADLPYREAVRIFGADFANEVFALPDANTWQGPVTGSLGTFLVRVIARKPAELPPFEAIRPAVEADWREETRRTENEKAIAELVSRYRVEIEGVTP